MRPSIAEKMTRYAKRRDANEKELVKVLRAMGFTITNCAGFGEGHPDLILKKGRTTWYVEIKNPNTSYGKRGLSASQKKWESETGNTIHILRNEEDCKSL